MDGTDAEIRVAAAALQLAGFNISPTLVPVVPGEGESGNVRAIVGPAVTADRLFLYFTRELFNGTSYCAARLKRRLAGCLYSGTSSRAACAAQQTSS